MRHSIIWGKAAKRIVAGLLVAAFWLLIWQALYLYVGKEILVVSPFRAAARLLELFVEVTFWRSVLASFLRVVMGFVLALLTGSLLAVLTVHVHPLNLLLRPVLSTIKATPVASFIILALIWLPSGRLPVFIAFLMVVPMVWTNLHQGIEHVDPTLLEMAKVFQLSTMKRLRLIYVPAIMPYFLVACTTGIGFAWKSVIAAEVISHPRNSIGTGIHNARVYLLTADLFAWTIAVILLSVMLEKTTVWLLNRLERKLLGNSRAGGMNK